MVMLWKDGGNGVKRHGKREICITFMQAFRNFVYFFHQMHTFFPAMCPISIRCSPLFPFPISPCRVGYAHVLLHCLQSNGSSPA